MKKYFGMFLCMLLTAAACSTDASSANKIVALDGVWYYNEEAPWGADEQTVFNVLGIEKENAVLIEAGPQDSPIKGYQYEGEELAWQGFPIKNIELCFNTEKLTTGEEVGFIGVTLKFDAKDVSLEQIHETVVHLYGLEPKTLREGTTWGQPSRSVQYLLPNCNVTAYSEYEEAVYKEYEEAWGLVSTYARMAGGIEIRQTEGQDIRLYIGNDKRAAVFNHVAAR